MQPYFFPYLGYWQLLNLVDRFVIYDDVNYIQRGWVNRNRILINGAPSYLTLPLSNASQNKLICEISIDQTAKWRAKMLKSIEGAYRKSPFYAEIFPVVENIIRYENANLSDFLKHQIFKLAEYIGIETQIVESSRGYSNTVLSGQERIIDICRREQASVYVNPEGGVTLYDSAAFVAEKLSIQFLKSNTRCYRQRSESFVPHLSVVDTLMAEGRDGVRAFLEDFVIIGEPF